MRNIMFAAVIIAGMLMWAAVGETCYKPTTLVSGPLIGVVLSQQQKQVLEMVH